MKALIIATRVMRVIIGVASIAVCSYLIPLSENMPVFTALAIISGAYGVITIGNMK